MIIETWCHTSLC